MTAHFHHRMNSKFDANKILNNYIVQKVELYTTIHIEEMYLYNLCVINKNNHHINKNYKSVKYYPKYL